MSFSQKTYNPHTDLSLPPVLPRKAGRAECPFLCSSHRYCCLCSNHTHPLLFLLCEIDPIPRCSTNTDASKPSRLTPCLLASDQFIIPGLNQLVLDFPLRGQMTWVGALKKKGRIYCSYFEEKHFLSPPKLEQVLLAATLWPCEGSQPADRAERAGEVGVGVGAESGNDFTFGLAIWTKRFPTVSQLRHVFILLVGVMTKHPSLPSPSVAHEPIPSLHPHWPGIRPTGLSTGWFPYPLTQVPSSQVTTSFYPFFVLLFKWYFCIPTLSTSSHV